MQFDDFDKKIKEAAEHHHPAYEEKAWKKMEKLLDKHLPVEKDGKRRIIFLLLFFLLGGLGIYLTIKKPWQQKIDTITTNNLSLPASDKHDASTTKKTNWPSGKTSSPKTEEPNTVDNNSTLKKENKTTTQAVEDKHAGSKVLLATPGQNKNKIEPEMSPTNSNKKNLNSENPINHPPVTKAITDQKKQENKTASVEIRFEKKEKVNSELPSSNENTSAGDKNNFSTTSADKPIENKNNEGPGQVNSSSAAMNKDTSSKTNTEGITKTDSIEKKEEVLSKKSNPKPAKRKKSAFAITITGGPDVSSVGLKNTGKVRLAYGAGLSYTLNRFTLRSGFYITSKVYTAGPDDYHPPAHNWIYYVNLTEVDADCKVYEIPVNISYAFSEAKNQNWFASAGLSSFLMKKETYGYYYKDSSMMPRYKEWTLKNGGNHIFSVLNLSAGYERKLNKTLSLIAEPYLKIPMDGIGFGKINLNSAGVLFTLSIRPFSRN